ncbi:MAG: hypothetical protein KDJ35_04695 [Alphaproteobacteria bacterium]|nr:hypothetical protein [Alphaproteobacteria bacterium]
MQDITDGSTPDPNTLILKFLDQIEPHIENYTDIENFVYSMIDRNGIELTEDSGLEYLYAFSKVLPFNELEDVFVDGKLERRELLGVLAAFGNRKTNRFDFKGLDTSVTQEDVQAMAEKMEKWGLDASVPSELKMIEGLVRVDKEFRYFSGGKIGPFLDQARAFINQDDNADSKSSFGRDQVGKIRKTANDIANVLTPKGEDSKISNVGGLLRKGFRNVSEVFSRAVDGLDGVFERQTKEALDKAARDVTNSVLPKGEEADGCNSRAFRESAEGLEKAAEGAIETVKAADFKIGPNNS